MCRFAAYIGGESILLNELLNQPENSLISQSRHAREGKLGLNADGFGVGWYNQEISQIPGVYRSIRPAWNDENLESIGGIAKSDCFIGHVRASTVGDVSELNCHPFRYEHYLFAHNGTIREFPLIKRKISGILTDQFYQLIRGNTDSEYFFAILMQLLHDFDDPNSLTSMKRALIGAIDLINEMQESLAVDTFSRINTVFSNGHGLVITKYVSNEDKKPMSLHYSKGAYVLGDPDDEKLMEPTAKKSSASAFIVSSEPLTDYQKEWTEIQTNSILVVDKEINISIDPLSSPF